MNIAVNTRLLLKGRLEGIGRFTFETLKRITVNHPEHKFYFLFDRPYDKSFIFSDNVYPLVIPPQARHPLLFYIWFDFSLPHILKKINADIFVSTDGYLSLKTDVKQLAVIHDLNFEHYPKDVPFLVRKYFKYFFPRFARKAQRIMTVSEFSKQDIRNLYNVSPDIIDVAYNGANEIFKPIEDNFKKEVRNKFTCGKDFFLFVGALHPRKNIKNLLDAFDIFKQNNSDFKLLIVGGKQWWTSELQHSYNKMKYKDDVVFTGRVNNEELVNIMGSAFALTYMSYFEGFGIPIIEAFSCKTPVITSNVTSMPEISGDAVLYANPFNPKEIAEKMIEITEDTELRNQIAEKGFERAKLYSWDKTADALWRSIEKCVHIA